MYTPNTIAEKLKDGMNHNVYGLTAVALSRKYGVSHVEYGTDDAGCSYAEIGLVAPYHIDTRVLTMKWEDYFKSDRIFNEDEHEFYKSLMTFYNTKIIPAVKIDIREPKERSTTFITKIINDRSLDHLDFLTNTYRPRPSKLGHSPSVLSEVIVRCYVDRESQDKFKIGNVKVMQGECLETFLVWYLTMWLSYQPMIESVEHFVANVTLKEERK